MKIAILTQPLRYNYGGILQNFALQTVLRRMGHDVVTLDPHRYLFPQWKYPYIFFRHAARRYIKGYKDTPIFAELLKDKETKLLGTNTFQFIDKNIIRKEYKNLYKDVKESDYDAFIVGSDQVWRPQYNRSLTRLDNMFLDFTEGWNVKRFAYAASFGIETWDVSNETTTQCKKLLKQFDYITVREYSGINICKQIFDVSAEWVVDPTLLLTKEDYISTLNLNNKKKSQGNLLLYILDYTDKKKQLVENIAKKYHLTPFRVNSDYEDRQADIKRRVQPPVEQWVRGFLDAEYVVTDSFHACVFAILFQKTLIVCVNRDRGSTRFTSLFKQLQIPFSFYQNNPDILIVSKFPPHSKEVILTLRRKIINGLREKLSI